jgi:hypothetical protein
MRARIPVLGRLLVLALALAIIALPACTTEVPPAPTPTSATFGNVQPVSVALLSADDGWMVGVGAGMPPTQMLHLQQGHWTAVPVDDSAGDTLLKVVLRSPTDGWAVGNHFYHYDGIRWTRLSSAQLGGQDNFVASDVAFLSPSEGWAVGGAGVLHYHAGEWADVSASLPEVPTPSPGNVYRGPGLRALAFASATEGWAVGYGGVIWRFDGRAWRPASASTTYFQNFPNAALTAVALTSPGEGWAVGGSVEPLWKCPPETGVIERLSGGTWTLYSSVRGSQNVDGRGGWSALRAVAMLSPTEGWAAGALMHKQFVGGEAPAYDCTATSYMLHLNEGLWTAVPVPRVGTINGLAFDSLDDGWAAADEGLLHYHAGTWTAVLM